MHSPVARFVLLPRSQRCIAARADIIFVANYASGTNGIGTIGEYTTSGAIVNASLIARAIRCHMSQETTVRNRSRLWGGNSQFLTLFDTFLSGFGKITV